MSELDKGERAPRGAGLVGPGAETRADEGSSSAGRCRPARPPGQAGSARHQGRRTLGRAAWIRAALLCAPALLILAGCPGPDRASSGGEPPAPAAQPIRGLQTGQWAWVPIPGSSCDDGSPTGIAVSQGPGPDLVLFLNGGGACWDYLTCYVLNLAAHGPFGQAEFEHLASTSLPGSILDRDLPGNPFAQASLVFLPYCTGDVHAGDKVVAYSGAGGQRVHHHAGRANIRASLPRIAATWPAPRRLVVSGASGGGFGAVLNYDAIRSAFPSSRAFLVDDSGPLLEPGALSEALLDAWAASWGLDDLLDPLCGASWRTGLSRVFDAVAQKYPSDRLALLSSLQDAVISNFFLLGGASFERQLLKMSGDAMAPRTNARFYFIPGDSHAMLRAPGAVAQGVPLLTWLSQQVDGDADWASQQP